MLRLVVVTVIAGCGLVGFFASCKSKDQLCELVWDCTVECGEKNTVTSSMNLEEQTRQLGKGSACADKCYERFEVTKKECQVIWNR